jgi:methylated-DNA-[protein]-cysteine S-methyltransferase
MVNHTFFVEHLTTQTGVLALVTDPQGRVRALDWLDHDARMQRLLARHYGTGAFVLKPHPATSQARRALERYFGGEVSAIDSIEVATAGTEFQRAVWRALRTIPAGTTLSYGTLATKIGRPAAVRAVGLANGANPIGIIVPCHRVIGADRSLTGYGGGLARKGWLLRHEGVDI